MNCRQARLFITTDFLEQGNRHLTDALQVHLLTCTTCRAFRDELAHIYKSYQHRDEIVPPSAFVQNLKVLYTKKKMPRAESAGSKPIWVKGVFALGLVVIFGSLFFWSQQPKNDLGKPRPSKKETQQQTVSQNQEKVSPEATTDTTLKPHDGGTPNPHDEGSLTSGFNSINYDEITGKVKTTDMPKDSNELSQESHDEDKLAPIVLDDNDQGRIAKISTKRDTMTKLDAKSDGGDSFLSPNSEDAEFIKDPQEAQDDLLQAETIKAEIKTKPEQENEIIEKLFEKMLEIDDQDPPCALTENVKTPTSMEFTDPGYAEFLLKRRHSVFLEGQEGSIMGASTEGDATSQPGSRALLNYKQVYYYLNARTPQTHGRLFSPRSLNRFLNQMQRSLNADSPQTEGSLSDWQNISEALDELETASLNEGNLETGMTEDKTPMTEDSSHALDVVDIAAADADEFDMDQDDQYSIDYCPVDP